MQEPQALSSLLILGAGGHGRVVADAAQCQDAWTRLDATDRDPARCAGSLLPGVPLRPIDAALAAGGPVHVAIGDNTFRRREAQAAGEHRLATVLHPQASVSAHAQVGPGCFVAARAVVAPQARLEMGVIVNHGAVVDHDTVVGAYTHVAPGACLGGAVVIGTGVLLGTGAVVLPGVRVCDGAVIGAGAVVTRDITQPGTHVGVPARRIS